MSDCKYFYFRECPTQADHHLQDEEVHAECPGCVVCCLSLSSIEPLGLQCPALLTTVTGPGTDCTVQRCTALYSQCTTTDGHIYAEILTASPWLITMSVRQTIVLQ